MDPDLRIRIHQKKSSKCKIQLIPDLDVVRIRESYQKQCECIRIRIPEFGPQIRIGSVLYGMVPLLRIQLDCNTSYVRVPNI
jgi:hypothetical protein